MRKGQDRKVNSSLLGKVGGASCSLLLLLAYLIVNPFTEMSVFAEDVDEEYGGNAAGFDGAAAGTADDGIETYGATASMVGISFSPSSASGAVTPVDATNGDKVKVDVQATVKVQNSGGYSVYVGSSSSQLKNGSNVIDSVTSASTYANLPLNRWGFSFRKASSSTDKTVTDSYVAMPTTLRSSPRDSNTNTKIISDTRYYMLSFAARIGSNKPAGTYTNSVTMSVVSSPVQLVLGDISEMQQMTSDICANTGSGATKQLKDTRDGKFYWVGKLADGKCWMTQNLDLDLNASTKLTADTSDVPAAGYTPVYNTVTTVDDTTILDSAVGQRSWSLGNYRITNPNSASDCGYPKNSAAGCPSQFTAYTTPTTANGETNAHYILGNHYQWNVAAAGTGGSTVLSGQATNSICAKGWRLPTSGEGGEFDALMTALGATSSTDSITKAPFYGVRGGRVSQAADSLLNRAGAEGDYWSSTPNSDRSHAYYFSFDGTSNLHPHYYYYRSRGYSVRCVAR